MHILFMMENYVPQDVSLFDIIRHFIDYTINANTQMYKLRVELKYL